MAKTSFATGDAATRKAWSEKLYRESRKMSYFEKFMGDSPESLVQLKNDLTKDKGDTVNFNLVMRLTNSGVTSGTILEGNETKLSTYSDSVTLEQYRNAVRDDGAMSRKRTTINLDKESESALKVWGSEKIDSLCFTAIQTTPTKTFYLDSSGVPTAGSAATAKAGLHATNSKLTLGLISFIKAWATTGGARTYVPLRPVKVKGKDYYVFLTSPDSLYDLKETSAFQQAMREAQDRGDENPLFTDATAIWHGVVIHEHENINLGSDGGGGSVNWSSGVFMGAQSLAFAWGAKPAIVYEEFDYKNEHGWAWDMICGVTKPQFNSLDYGSVGVYTANTDVSGV